MNRADLSGLQTFLAIVEHGTMRAAAHELGVNPSAVSQRLKAFEDVLGSALFVRDTRSVSLTDVGEALRARTHHLLGEVDAALDATCRTHHIRPVADHIALSRMATGPCPTYGCVSIKVS